MNVHELSREQLIELKQNYLIEIMDRRTGESPSWGELAEANEIVSDEEVFEFYADTVFVPDDFSCSMEEELPWWERP